MKLEGAVVLVIGADTALGAAVVRGLLSRLVAKVYADAPLDRCEISVSCAAPLFVEIGKHVPSQRHRVQEFLKTRRSCSP